MSIQAMTAAEVAAAAPAATTTAAPATAEATTTEPTAIPNTLEALKAARRATATEAPKAGEPTKTEAPKPGKTTKTVEVKLDEGSLAKFTKLNAELAEARAKIAALEPKAPHADKVEKATKLISEGKAFDAIIDLVGIKAFNAAVAEVTGATDKKPPLTEAEQAARDELETLKKDNASNKELLTAAAEREREAGVTMIISEVQGSEKARFPFLSRSPAWVRDALKGADEAFVTANALCLKDRGRHMNNEERNNLLRVALETAEEEHAERAKLYAPSEAPPPAAAPKPTPRTIDRSMRGSVTKMLPHKKSATLEELKRERRQRS
jgi:hypothetical protein